ncbi:MAG: hypothetical protein JRE18_08690 [Deltaproteobacteria bacterium]|jgi:hypothetical protein|nr:hypothetical protein [Deltaproteobacteria bacterium]
MIDGTRCYNIMTELEQRRWQGAVIYGGGINYVLNKKYATFKEFLELSFVWSDTKEGHDYWEEISKKYILHDILSPPKKFNNLKPPKPFK